MSNSVPADKVIEAGCAQRPPRSSSQQAAGTEQIGDAIRRIDQITRQNDEAAMQSGAATEELTASSKQLEDVVLRLTELVGGQAANTARP